MLERACLALCESKERIKREKKRIKRRKKANQKSESKDNFTLCGLSWHRGTNIIAHSATEPHQVLCHTAHSQNITFISHSAAPRVISVIFWLVSRDSRSHLPKYHFHITLGCASCDMGDILACVTCPISHSASPHVILGHSTCCGSATPCALN